MYRALRYAGVRQRDWSVGQFLFPAIEPSKASNNQDMSNLALVAFDFAFAEQHMCLCHTPVVEDAGLLKLFLLAGGIDRSVVDTHFTPRDEFEW
jgi:hypothetical protein